MAATRTGPWRVVPGESTLQATGSCIFEMYFPAQQEIQSNLKDCLYKALRLIPLPGHCPQITRGLQHTYLMHAFSMAALDSQYRTQRRESCVRKSRAC